MTEQKEGTRQKESNSSFKNVITISGLFFETNIEFSVLIQFFLAASFGTKSKLVVIYFRRVSVFAIRTYHQGWELFLNGRQPSMWELNCCFLFVYVKLLVILGTISYTISSIYLNWQSIKIIYLVINVDQPKNSYIVLQIQTRKIIYLITNPEQLK